MSSGSIRRVSCQDIQVVENLIEQCLQLYMSQKEVVETLLDQAKIEPGFTELVWQKLEEENQEFFRAYYLRLMVKQQINEFNRLLDLQVQLMCQMQPSGVASLPTCNGSHISSLHQNSACYASEHTVPAVKTENMYIPIVSGLPNAFTNAGSLLHPSMHTAVQMPAHSSRIDAPPSMLSAQSSNMGMIQGINGGMIKSETGYSGSSPYMYGSDRNVLEMHPTIEDASVESFPSVQSNSQPLNEQILDMESSSFGSLGQDSRNFSLSDLAADFSQSSGIKNLCPTMSSSSDFYSSFSHHLCSRDRCAQRTSLTLDNFGRRFYGCHFYDEKEVQACKFCEWLDKKTCKCGSEVAPIVLAKFKRLENEAKASNEREKLAREMEEKARERESIARRREEKSRVREMIARVRARMYRVTLVVSWVLFAFFVFSSRIEDVGLKSLSLA
ncbi:uncharacterized protein LOC115952763 [Quercus lobata]|uniref:uncharacterized protein LOC115952763 n=1 Tax=Quercus lobata TaxID=97700 RepID=UPI0012472A5A|nr:uncharacterized protein LOC115952763 [Quercus lobata]